MLRTNLEFSRLGGDGVRTILVTSAIEGEDKSTTAANLAIALARSGQLSALVDLDFRRPYLHRFFHINHAQGVTDVALGKAATARALHHVDVSGGLFQRNGHLSEAEAVGSWGFSSRAPCRPNLGEFVGTTDSCTILAELRSTHDRDRARHPADAEGRDALTLSAQAEGSSSSARLNMIRRPMLSRAAPCARRHQHSKARLRCGRRG